MKVKPLIEKVETNDFLRQYLNALGIKDVRKYLKGDNFENPWKYPNMKKGVERLNKAILDNERIGILVDEDNDGACSSAIIYHFIKKINIKQDVVVFFHACKGHGLVQNQYEDIVQQCIESGIDLLITPDSSSNDTEQCRTLKENEIDVLILDHHEIEKENPYAIVINHHLGKDLNVYLSGAGVTYQFVRAYCEYYDIVLKNEYIDLVATSLVTDVCNMTSEENYSFIKKGLNNLTNPLLIKLFEKFSPNEITPYTIAWRIGPKINATFRTEDTEVKKVLFYGFVGEYDIDKAIEMAKSVHKEQTNTVKEVLQDVKDTLDENHKIIIGFTEEKYRGYSGLIAGRLCDEYNKPSFVIRELNNTTWSGSMRSPMDLAQQINESGFAKCQGHNNACGIFIPKSKLNKFIEWFDKQDLNVETVKPVTACINPFDITLDLCHDCIDNELLWCGGEGGKVVKPRFYVCFETLPSSVSIFIKKTNTARFDFGDVSLIKFKVSKDEVNLLQSKKCKIEAIIELDVNVWNDVETPQGKINTWEINEIEENEDDWMEWF